MAGTAGVLPCSPAGFLAGFWGAACFGVDVLACWLMAISPYGQQCGFEWGWNYNLSRAAEVNEHAYARMARMCLKRSHDFETSLLSFGQAAPRRVRLRCPFPPRCVAALRRPSRLRRVAISASARDRTSCAVGGTPFQMKQIIPFRLHIDRAKWDFLLHLEYRDGERVRSCGRVTRRYEKAI